MGGLSINTNHNNPTIESHSLTHKIFLLSNYLLLGAASSCIFLILSLRLIPSVYGALLIFLQIFTISGAVFGCTAVSEGSNKWYAAHMIATVLTAVFQGSVSVLVFTTTSDFLDHLKSYVNEENGTKILKLAGGLCIVVFCLEWVALGLAFMMRYYAFVEGNNGGASYYGRSNGRVQDEDMKNPMPFQPYQV
ncbi:hypothetical protein Leryth_024759 [Lithospermum erythrorhizon]|uniref:Uncharacterized protein n=1 Tax=Lithospermum erythrorhizon TaxID=34254 RepID=A0AAV3Q3M9_LITER|nr:hypothetical protein Leryth_024759 [Lithospermum erythrorhizon]